MEPNVCCTIEDDCPTKDKTFGTIIDIAYDYDGCRSIKSLKGLVDELVNYAKIGLKLPPNAGVMSKNEFSAEMMRLRDEYTDDISDQHIAMDGLMVQVLLQLGYNDGVDVYQNTERYYS